MRNTVRRRIPLLFAVLLAGGAATAQSPARVTSTLLVHDVTVLDGTGGSPQTHVDVLLRDGRIEQVTAVRGQESPRADLTVNGVGLFAIPGLFDAHVHLSGAPLANRVDELRRTVCGGVTGVFDLAGDLRETSDLARMAIADEITAPAIYYAALVSGPAFFSDPRVVASSLGFRPGDAPWAKAVTPETDLVRAVAAARGTGARALKLYAALDAPTVRRIADEGRRQEMRLVAHGTVFPAKPSDLVAAGVNMLAHVAYLVWEGSPASDDFTKRATGDFAHVPPGAPAIERLLVAMREHDVALNPTLWIFERGPASTDAASGLRTPWMNAVTRRAAELGVPIVAGTDDMIGESGERLPTLHRELELMVTAGGLTPMQALVAATRNAARAIGVEATRGTIEPGKGGDLVLLEANPAEDIRNTQKIRFVVKNGKIVFEKSSE